MSSLQQFGGDWTIEKLEILTGYLDAYLTALKNMKFKKIYIDAFAGTGAITTRDESKILVGSAKRALMADNKFDHYYFIEANKKKANELGKMIADEFPDLQHLTTVYCGDANARLTQILQNIDWRFNRALLFLDPCATEVEWTTLQAVACTKAIDVWYLFPFSALNRMLCKDGKIDKLWEQCIDKLLGDSGWREEFYEEDMQLNFFDSPGVIKDASTDHMQKYILQRLGTIFSKVASNPRILKNEKNSPLFLFCFAIANPSPKAQTLALTIAEYILGKKR